MVPVIVARVIAADVAATPVTLAKLALARPISGAAECPNTRAGLAALVFTGRVRDAEGALMWLAFPFNGKTPSAAWRDRSWR